MMNKKEGNMLSAIKPEMLEKLVRLTEDAGRLAIKCDREAVLKDDGSEVTPADMASHAFLVAGIRKLLGRDARILSEEENTTERGISKGISIVIDPLDGTTNFKNGKRNWSVLLAVLQEGVPVFGVAVAPAYGVTACGGTLFNGAELRLHHKETENPREGYKFVRRLSKIDNNQTTAIVPRRFVEAVDPDDRAKTRRAMDSFQQAAGKVTFKSSGQILGSMMPVLKKDVRYRVYSATKPGQMPGDWDLAAWDAILRGMGGIMTTNEGKPVSYGLAQNDFRHEGFVCWRVAAEAQAYGRKLNPPVKAGFPAKAVCRF